MRRRRRRDELREIRESQHGRDARVRTLVVFLFSHTQSSLKEGFGGGSGVNRDQLKACTESYSSGHHADRSLVRLPTAPSLATVFKIQDRECFSKKSRHSFGFCYLFVSCARVEGYIGHCRERLFSAIPADLSMVPATASALGLRHCVDCGLCDARAACDAGAPLAGREPFRSI